MATRILDSAPRILPLYARAATALVPGASLLPLVPGGGGGVPDLELALPGVRADPKRVAAYARICGFPLRSTLPPTYPHLLAFPLQMAIMVDGKFPFGAVGLLHIGNRIIQHRPIEIGEELELTTRATPLSPHRSGSAFTLISEVRVAGKLTWESVSTMLRRGPGTGEGKMATPVLGVPPADFLAIARWRAEADLGRRYAAISGDRNPIHLHPLSARPLGFPAAIAHGMWTKARALAALGPQLPDALEVEVRFRKPILLPADVELGISAHGANGSTDFTVRDSTRGTTHLDGLMRPLDPISHAKKTGRQTT